LVGVGVGVGVVVVVVALSAGEASEPSVSLSGALGFSDGADDAVGTDDDVVTDAKGHGDGNEPGTVGTTSDTTPPPPLTRSRSDMPLGSSTACFSSDMPVSCSFS
jgi:hypothetical protein